MHIKLNTWKLAFAISLTASTSMAAFGVSTELGCALDADSAWSHYSSAELFIEGSILMEEKFWHEAERVWAYAIQSRPKNRVLKYKRALCLYEIGDNWVATNEAFQEVVRGQLTLRYDPFNPNQKLPPYEAWLGLASTEHRLGQFELARQHVDDFLAKAGEKHPSTEWASKILAEIRFAERELANPSEVSVTPVAFNSESHETRPILTADGRTLFFSSNRSRSNGSNHGRLDPNTREHFYDIYKTSLAPDSTWTEPELLNVGLRYHATVVGSDAFGEKLLVLDNDGWNSELKVTQKWERGWTVAEPFDLDKKISNQGEIVFFPDKNRLVASVKKRSGEGGYDLYESSLGSNGKWSKLKSLGSRVNTWGDEVTPFVAADGQTLFFASNGLQSMGGFDIYRTTRNAAGGWTEPEHLGSPINSVGDDMAFAIGAKGEMGYFATRRDNAKGDLELYQARMSGVSALEEEVVVFSLNATGVEKNEQPDVLVVRNVESGEIVQRVEKGRTEDVFNFILPVGSDFIVESEKLASNDSRDVDEGETTSAVRRRISLPEGSKAEVVEATFEEVFVAASTQSDTEGDAGDVFVVEPRPVVLPAEEVEEEVAEEIEEKGPEEIAEEVAEEAAEEVAEEVVEEAAEEVAEEVVEEVADEVAEEVAEEVAVQPQESHDSSQKPTSAMPKGDSFAQRSEPIAPLALGRVNDANMLMAIQLYSGQVHTGRMDLGPVLDVVEASAKQGKAVIRIEGSASDGPSSRAGGNMELASSRAMDVYLRLVRGLEARGLNKGEDYAIRVIRRVQPDGDTPASFKNSAANPASFQYVRVDLSVE